MKRIVSLALAGVFLLALLVQPGTAQTAKEILEKMIEVQGGKKAIESIKDMTLSGTIEMPMQGLSGAISVYKKEPNKRRVDVELMGMVFAQAYDGKAGWWTNPQTGGVEDMSEDQLTEAKREAMPVISILYPEKYGITITYKGKESIEGKDYFVLHELYSDGFETTLFIDTETYLIFKSKMKTPGPMGNEVEMEQFQSDYRKENGLLMAHNIIAYAEGEEIQKIIIEEVKFNTGLDDSLFEKE